MFLEVTEPQASAPAWSYFVSHRLSVVNKDEAKNVTKESQNRCVLAMRASDVLWTFIVVRLSAAAVCSTCFAVAGHCGWCVQPSRQCWPQLEKSPSMQERPNDSSCTLAIC